MGEASFGSLSRNAFTPINSEDTANTSPHTISPNDIFMDHSAPNSNVMTNLTTPSMYDGSPDDLDSFENSPLFMDTNGVTRNEWPSLFDNEYAPADMASSIESIDKPIHVNPASVSMARTVSASSVNSATNVDASERPDSSHTRHRLSLIAGVQKNKRTGRALPPIEVEEGDSKALKRAKNTMAARKSRQKKRDIEDSLRNDLAKMTAERDRWMHVAIAHGAPIPETKVSIRHSEEDDD